MYAVVDRSFLCDCQLDIEHHATILRQLSSCTDNRTAHFRVEFVVNLGFYQLLRNRCPNLVENVRPNAKGRAQIFNVRLALADQTPLGEPTDLKDALERIGQHGRLRPIVGNPHTHLPPVLARHTGHVLSIIATILSVGLFLLVGLFFLRHFKLWTLVIRSDLSLSPKGCRCLPPTCHDRCMFQSLFDYLGYHGDDNCNRHVDLYPLPTPNLAPQIQVQSSLHALHIPVQQPLLRPVKN